MIAALNEAAALPLLLADLAAQQNISLDILVADGGSSDDTAAITRAAGARLVPAPRGRAAQFNAGAAAASAELLLFLHADSRFASRHQLADALTAMRASQSGALPVAGHWRLRFAREAQGHAYFFRYVEGKTASNRPGSVNGDQGLLLHRDYFARLGGFDASLPYFEDQRIAARIFACGQFLLLPGALITSARRFEREGHGPRYALMALIIGMEAGGLQALMAELPSLYRAQAEAERLDLVPILCGIHAHLAALSPTRRAEVWQGVGQLLLQNAWQLAHALDSFDAARQARATALFEHFLAPQLSRPLAHKAATQLGRNVLGLCFASARLARELRRWPGASSAAP